MKNLAQQPKPRPLTPLSRLETLVENRSVYNLENCEMNIFETHQEASNVRLCFNSLTFTAMLRGKKIMHLFGNQHFEYFPSESVIVPADEPMLIDFPEATLQNPTQCIALAIDKDKIRQTIDRLNERYKKIDQNQWYIDSAQYHLKNTQEISNTIDRLIHISTDTNQAKDILAELALEELLIRLMQSQFRQVIVENYQQNVSRYRFAYLVKYIKENLAQNFTIKQLSDLACMSESHFFKTFKRELGISPVDFILQERINAAKKLLIETNQSITDICFAVGFNSVHYFSSVFSKHEQQSPKQYRQTKNGSIKQ